MWMDRLGKWSRLTGTVVLTAAVTVFGLKLAGVDFSPLGADASYQKFVAAYTLLSESYFQDVSTKRLMDGATEGMTRAVDDYPFTVYMDQQTTKRFRDLVTSHFQGIGAVLAMQGGKLAVSSVLAGSPAQKAGLLPGDVLLQINGQRTDGMSLEQAVQQIRGVAGTHVVLSVLRGANQTVTLKLTRAQVTQATVYARLLPGHIGYLLITQFSEGTATAFMRDLDILQKSGMRGLIIDVRDDPGGLLQSVAKIANDLLPRGSVIVQIDSRNHKRQVVRATGSTVHVPMVCLIDGGSASAAEILAAALNESAHVPLIGERTYGKGTVQETEDFRDGSSIKITVARWLTPDGQWIHKRGIAPTVAVPMPAYFRLPLLSLRLRKEYGPDTSGVPVAVLQRMLLALGFDPGRTDGYYGVGTERAVAAFQKVHKIPATGVVNSATAYALDVSLVGQKQREDPQLTAAIGYLRLKLMG
ncbi:MAG: S41 family peptidase [Bacilli bacterium]